MSSAASLKRRGGICIFVDEEEMQQMIEKQEPTVRIDGVSCSGLKAEVAASKSRLSSKTLTFSANTPTTSVEDEGSHTGTSRPKRKPKKCSYCGGYTKNSSRRRKCWYRWYQQICCCCCRHFRVYYRYHHQQQQQQQRQQQQPHLSSASSATIKECICGIGGSGIGVGE